MPETEGWLSLKCQEKPRSMVSVEKASLLISIPKKVVFLATERNKIKRLIREAFRHRMSLNSKKAYLFRVVRYPGNVGLREINDAMDTAIAHSKQ